MKSGFSLVELSIVLVILGLLTGGILAGQSLIRAAELRSVNTEYQRYYTASLAFRDKYFAIPGDMTNATAFWGKDNVKCTADSGTTTVAGTCNGDGGGMIGGAGSAGATGELYRYWQQLALAGLIEGTYTGYAGPAAGADHVIGTNAPRSKMNNGGWGITNRANYAGDAAIYAYDYGNMFMFGAQQSGNLPELNITTPEETWNIDTKMDDGKPGSGKLMVRNWQGSATGAWVGCGLAS